MISAELRDEIAKANWFVRTDIPYLLVDSDHRMVAANAAYESATGHPWSVLAFENLFDVFPDNPHRPESDGTGKLAASLERVLSTGRRDWMGVVPYDVRDLAEPGRFVHKVWVPVNTPIREAGRTVAVLHHVEDVTAVCGPDAAGVPPALQAEAEQLGRYFPALPGNAVVGVLVHSRLVSAQISGAPDVEAARRLAVMRLEVLAGHPAREPEE